MKNFLIAFLLCIAAATCYSATADAVDSTGKPIYLSNYHGKWVFVNYWATWCHNCIEEIPQLNTFYKKHADKAVVLGVSFDGLSNAQIQDLAKIYHMDFPLLSHFPIAKFGINEIPALPVTFVISPKGKLSKTLYGQQTEESLENNLR